MIELHQVSCRNALLPPLSMLLTLNNHYPTNFNYPAPALACNYTLHFREGELYVQDLLVPVHPQDPGPGGHRLHQFVKKLFLKKWIYEK